MGAADSSVHMFDCCSAPAAGAFFDHLYIAPLGQLPEAARDMGELAADCFNKLGGTKGSYRDLNQNSDSPGLGKGLGRYGADPECDWFLIVGDRRHSSPSIDAERYMNINSFLPKVVLLREK